LVLDGLKKLHGNVKASIGPMGKLLCIPYSSKWSPSLGLAVIGTSTMPPVPKSNSGIIPLIGIF